MNNRKKSHGVTLTSSGLMLPVSTIQNQNKSTNKFATLDYSSSNPPTANRPKKDYVAMFTAEIEKRPAPHSTYVTDNESERLGVYNNNLPIKKVSSAQFTTTEIPHLLVEVNVDNISIVPPKPHVTRRQHKKEADNLEKVNEEADY